MEAVKACCNAVRDPPLHFFRAPDGLEVDLPMEDAGKLRPVEIKAAQTYHPSMGRNLCRFDAIAGEVERPTVVCGPFRPILRVFPSPTWVRTDRFARPHVSGAGNGHHSTRFHNR